MSNEVDSVQELVNSTIHDIAVEVAKISMSRESQNTETDPAQIAEAVWAKYTIAKRHLMQKTQNVTETILNNRKVGIF